jgi:hypothetical protein
VEGLDSTTIIKTSPALTVIGWDGSVRAGMLEDAGSAGAGVWAGAAQAAKNNTEASKRYKVFFM